MKLVQVQFLFNSTNTTNTLHEYERKFMITHCCCFVERSFVNIREKRKLNALSDDLFFFENCVGKEITTRQAADSKKPKNVLDDLNTIWRDVDADGMPGN